MCEDSVQISHGGSEGFKSLHLHISPGQEPGGSLPLADVAQISPADIWPFPGQHGYDGSFKLPLDRWDLTSIRPEGPRAAFTLA